jgi:Tfp pilus assembly protein PilF
MAAPGDADYRAALALLSEHRPEAALPHILAAGAEAPADVDVMLLHGQIMVELQRFDEAEAIYRAGLALAPDRYQLISHLGVALFELDRFGEALELLRQAFRMAPQNGRVVANLGNFLDFAGSLDLALAAYDAALSLLPEDRDIRSNYGMALLRVGRLAEGWPHFEARRRIPDPIEATPVPRLPPLSTGPDLAGRRILLFHEQGLGDTLQMLRYAPLLAERGARIALRLPPPLAPLVAGMGGAAIELADEAGVEGFDFQCPMMGLPLVFGTVLETIPAEMPYLWPAPAAVERWRAAVAALPGPRIGLVWAGSPRGGLDRRRSMGFDRLAPLFEFPAGFVNLQIGPAGRHWAPPPGASALDPTALLGDFAETAALIANLDLVITVDTSVAHLAGALGAPIWMLSRFSSCWRWLMGRDDSPWYPSMRLFRQNAPGDWDGVVAQAAAALRGRYPGI